MRYLVGSLAILIQTILLAASAVAATSGDSFVHFSKENVREKTRVDLPAVLSVLTPGEDLAGAYVLDANHGADSVKRLEGDDYLSAIASSYVRADFNHDGRMDLAVIVETAPGTSNDHETPFGDRTLRVYLADSSGALKLADQNTHISLRADAGGLIGDPNGGLSFDKNGLIVIANRGGGGQDSWSVEELFRVRDGQIHFVGRRDSDFNVTKGLTTVHEVNLLKGTKLTTTKTESASHSTRSLVVKHPLLTLSEVPDLF